MTLVRKLHEEGNGVYLLYHGELGRAWVGQAGKVVRLPQEGQVEGDGFRALKDLVEPPAFFMIGPCRAGRQGAYPALAIMPEQEWCLGPGPEEATDPPLPTPGLPSGDGSALAEGWQGEPAGEYLARLAAAAARVDSRQGKIIVTRGLKRAIPEGRSWLDLAQRYLPIEPGAAAVHLCLLPGGIQSMGVSPENVLELRNGDLILDAVAGSAPLQGNSGWERNLLDSPKEAWEHQLALSRAQAFAERVCEPGSAGTDFRRRIRRLRNIAHLHSRTRGRLRDGIEALDLVALCHPPLLSYPDELRGKDEPNWHFPRFYGGQVGRWESRNELSSFLNLRCLESEGGWLHTRSGVGIVDGADPQAEFKESLDKLATIFEAVQAWAGS